VTITTGARSAFQIVRPKLADIRIHHDSRIYRFPFVLVLLGLLLYLLVSDSLLVSQGIPYNTPSGSFLFKQHPGTYLIFLGFVILLFQGHPRDLWVRLFANASAPLLLGGVVLGILIYTGIRFGPSGNAYFIDTLLAPALLATVLLQVPLEWRRMVFRMVLVLIIFNALLGIGESLTHWRITPYLIDGEPAIEEFFRATALAGHPLKNSLRTATLLIACLILPIGFRLFLIPLLLIALLAFGSRAALVLSVMLLGAWAFYQFFKDIVTRTLDPRLVFGLFFATLVIAVGIVSVIVSLGLGQRIFETFYWDTSAQHRILVLKALDFLSVQDWLWGMGPVGRQTILDKLISSSTMSGYENFWVMFLVQIGLAWSIPLSLALLWMIASLIRRTPSEVKLAALVFLILASSNNSLATKSQDLAILVAILIGASAEAALMVQSPSKKLNRGRNLRLSLRPREGPLSLVGRRVN
jgi:hypothetical protein